MGEHYFRYSLGGYTPEAKFKAESSNPWASGKIKKGNKGWTKPKKKDSTHRKAIKKVRNLYAA